MLDKKKLRKDNFRIFKRLYNIDKNSSKNKFFRTKNNHEFSVDSVVNNKNWGRFWTPNSRNIFTPSSRNIFTPNNKEIETPKSRNIFTPETQISQLSNNFLSIQDQIKEMRNGNEDSLERNFTTILQRPIRGRFKKAFRGNFSQKRANPNPLVKKYLNKLKVESKNNKDLKVVMKQLFNNFSKPAQQSLSGSKKIEFSPWNPKFKTPNGNSELRNDKSFAWSSSGKNKNNKMNAEIKRMKFSNSNYKSSKWSTMITMNPANSGNTNRENSGSKGSPIIKDRRHFSPGIQSIRVLNDSEHQRMVNLSGRTKKNSIIWNFSKNILM